MTDDDVDARRRRPSALHSPGARRIVDLVTVAAAILVVAQYAFFATALLTYPHDWGPDEGLFLDYARRLVTAPATLYPPVVGSVPSPSYWTPLFPALLAPIVAMSSEPLFSARAVVCGVAACLMALVALLSSRRRPVIGLAIVALVLSPMPAFYLFVRMDALMFAGWLAAAFIVLPSERIATLSWRRAMAGSVAIICAILAKQTAFLLTAPLVVVWLFFDKKSFARLATSTVALGLVCLVALQVVTAGGFLSNTVTFWIGHPPLPGHALRLLSTLASSHAALLIFALVGIAVGLKSGALRRDASWSLVIGGVSFLPMLSKFGAGYHYGLPLAMALAVVGSRGFVAHARVGGAAAALLGFITATTVPLAPPTDEDDATAAEFYGLVRALSDDGPVFSSISMHASFVAGDAVEAETSTLGYIAMVDPLHPLIAEIERRTREGHYALFISAPPWTATSPAISAALVSSYRPLAACTIRYASASHELLLFVRRDVSTTYTAQNETRCRGVDQVPPVLMQSAAARGAR